MKKLQLFADADDSLVDKVAMTVTCEVFKKDEKIVKINDEADCMFFILAGSVVVIGETDVIHAEMGAGTSFGEVGIMLSTKRTASIQAKEDCKLFKLSKASLMSVISQYPETENKLKELAQERYSMFVKRTVTPSHSTGEEPTHKLDLFDMEVSIQNLLRLPMFANAEPAAVNALASNMIRKTWKVDEFIIRCGDVGDSMFFLVYGTVDIITEFNDVCDTVTGPSAYFGEVAILESVPRTASVRCKGDCSTYELKKDIVIDILKSYPGLGLEISNTAHDRLQKYLMRNVLA